MTAVRLAMKRRLTSLRDGTHGSFDRVPFGVPLLSAKNISGGRLDITEAESCISEADYESIHRSGYLQFGDVLLSIVGSIGNAAIFDTHDRVAFQRSVAILRPDSRLLPRFLFYQTQAPFFQAHLQSVLKMSAQGGVYLWDLGETPILAPPIREQQAIADYLDLETARIDALVLAKERVLTLLAEKRHALMTRAVSRGCDPHAHLRDSGVPWLGEIPEHWETERARWLFKERDERSVTGEEELLTVSHLTGVTPRSEKDVNMFEAETTEGYKRSAPGDLVINTLWAWMGAMGVSPVEGIVSPAYNVYEPNGRLEPSYIDAVVRLPIFAQEVTRYSKGVWSSRLRLYPEGFFEVYLPVPPPAEQRAIVAHVAKENAKLNELRIATERTTRLLKERRAALIGEAVTGQLGSGTAA